MRHLTRAAATILAAGLLALLSLTPAAAYTNGMRFASNNICIADATGSNNWQVGDVANMFESGTATVTTGYRVGANSCQPQYVPQQTIRVYLYSAPDGRCAKTTYDTHDWRDPRLTSARTYDTNTYPTIWINQWYWAGCRQYSDQRLHNVAHQMGWLLGLLATQDCRVSCMAAECGFLPTALDRGDLYWLYTQITTPRQKARR